MKLEAGIFTLTFLVLLVLKLLGKINISWWWVFSPLLIGIGIFISILIFTGLVLLIGALID